MDYIIRNLTKNYLLENIIQFKNILKDEKYEYWDEKNFLIEKDLKFNLSLVISKENEIIGYIIASQKNSTAYIHKFMIKKEFRSFGIGSKLLKEFERNALKYNLYSIELSVIEDNTNAIKFYLKNNFKIIGKRKDIINNINLLILTKSII